MNPIPAIKLTNLRKQYAGGYAPAVDGLSLSIAAGKITGLLGPNGAGKTTTISIVCGLLDADAGSAVVFGQNVVEERTAIRRIIGLVPQKIALFGNLTAAENFRYIGALYGMRATAVKAKANELLQRMDLAKHAHKRIARYSGGMKRRANIIASLLHQPRLVILDEPTAGVDVQSRALIMDFLKERSAEGDTIIYTSHLLDEAEQLCDEVAIIDNGRLVAEGTPQSLVDRIAGAGRLEDVFLSITGHSIRD